MVVGRQFITTSTFVPNPMGVWQRVARVCVQHLRPVISLSVACSDASLLTSTKLLYVEPG